LVKYKLAKITSPRRNICAFIRVGISVAKPGGRVKKEIKNREGFLMKVFKACKGINTIVFLSKGS
jgi:hypothetical protein